MTAVNNLILSSGIKLIAISGAAGSGKDTVCNFLCDTYKDYYYEPFAYGLKQAAAAAFGIPEEAFHDRDKKEIPDPFWQVSPRKIAQFFGTEMFRQTIKNLIPHVQENFWVERMYGRLNGHLVPDDVGAYEPGDTVVIPDLRFQNEYEFLIANKAIILHLTRPGADGTVGIPNHPSEAGINFHTKENFYEIINDGTIAELHRKVANIITASTMY